MPKPPAKYPTYAERKTASGYDASPIQVKLTLEQKDILSRAGDALGMSISGLLRSAGLERARDILAKMDEP